MEALVQILKTMEQIAPENVSRADLREFAEHVLDLLGRIDPAQEPPKTLWHYTSAAGLEGILKTGTLFAAHITCLNDSSELNYLSDLMTIRLSSMLKQADGFERHFLNATIKGQRDRDITESFAFVLCFTGAKDDLGQWRGYGGGECGYAIEFDAEELTKASSVNRPGMPIMRVRYDEKHHAALADGLIAQTRKIYDKFVSRSEQEKDLWMRDLYPAYIWFTALVMALVKHPKFRDEREYRYFVTRQEGDQKIMEFRQKKTLLARYIPLDFKVDGRLPIKSIMVGPSADRKVSQASVKELLRKHGYVDVDVDPSVIPFRLP